MFIFVKRKEVIKIVKEKRFLISLSDEERVKLTQEAEKAGFKSISEFVRYCTIGEGRSIQADLKNLIEKFENAVFNDTQKKS